MQFGKVLLRAALAVLLACGAQVVLAERLPVRLAANERLAEQWVAQRVLSEAYARAGLSLQIEAMPPARANIEAVRGLLDGEVARIYAYGERNPTLIRVKTPIYSLTTVAFSVRDRMVGVKKPEDLSRYSVGALRGVAHSDRITQGHSSVTFTQTAEQMFRMLRAGRFDVAMDTGINGRYVIGSKGLDDIVASPDLASLELYHYVHSKHASLAERIDSVLQKMQASGELDGLRKRAETELQYILLERFSGLQTPATLR